MVVFYPSVLKKVRTNKKRIGGPHTQSYNYNHCIYCVHSQTSLSPAWCIIASFPVSCVGPGNEARCIQYSADS